MRHRPFGLRPNLRTKCLFVRIRVVRIVVLIHTIKFRIFCAHRRFDVLIMIRVIRRHPARGDDDLTPVRPHGVDLLLTRLLIRDHDVWKSTNRTRHRDRRTRVPTRRRDDRHPRLQLSRFQRSRQNFLRDSILNTPARIQVLALAINLHLWIRTEFTQIDHRRPTDELLRHHRSVRDSRVRRPPVLRLRRRVAEHRRQRALERDLRHFRVDIDADVDVFTARVADGRAFGRRASIASPRRSPPECRVRARPVRGARGRRVRALNRACAGVTSVIRRGDPAPVRRTRARVPPSPRDGATARRRGRADDVGFVVYERSGVVS